MPIPDYFPIPEWDNSKTEEKVNKIIDLINKLENKEKSYLTYSEITEFLPYLIGTLAKICLENNIKKLRISTNFWLIKATLNLFVSPPPEPEILPKNIQVKLLEEFIWQSSIYEITFKDKNTLGKYLKYHNKELSILLDKYLDYVWKIQILADEIKIKLIETLENKVLKKHLDKLILLTFYFEYKKLNKNWRSFSNQTLFDIITVVKNLVNNWYLKEENWKYKLTQKWIEKAENLQKNKKLNKLFEKICLYLQLQFN